MNRLALLLPIFFLFLPAGTPRSQPGKDGMEPFYKDSSFLKQLDDETFSSMGLDKLSEDELGRLCGVFGHAPFFQAGSYLDLEAARFLEEEGWRPVQVVGLYFEDPEDDDDPLLILADGYEVLLLDPFGSIDPLPPPGLHWGKNVISSWDILLPDGTKRRFIAE